MRWRSRSAAREKECLHGAPEVVVEGQLQVFVDGLDRRWGVGLSFATLRAGEGTYSSSSPVGMTSLSSGSCSTSDCEDSVAPASSSTINFIYAIGGMDCYQYSEFGGASAR